MFDAKLLFTDTEVVMEVINQPFYLIQEQQTQHKLVW